MEADLPQLALADDLRRVRRSLRLLTCALVLSLLLSVGLGLVFLFHRNREVARFDTVRAEHYVLDRRGLREGYAHLGVWEDVQPYFDLEYGAGGLATKLGAGRLILRSFRDAGQGGILLQAHNDPTDENGAARNLLEAAFYDSQRRPRIVLAVDQADEPSITLLDADGQPVWKAP